jgi:hypothetical protein
MKKCKKLSYKSIRKMWSDAEWARDLYFDLGIAEEYLRYQKIATRLYNAMMRFEKINTLKAE